MRHAFDKIWFKEHQKVLLWFANSIFGRMIFRYKKMGLQLDKTPIIKISPNSVAQYVWLQNRIQIREHFFIKNEYAAALRLWFYPIWYMFHCWDILIANNLKPAWNLGFDTLTVNPDANPETTTVDGATHYDLVNATWAQIHDAAAGGYASPSDAGLYAARLESDAAVKYPTMVRCIFLFDISGLAAGATITGGVMSTYGTNVSDGFGSQSLSLVGSTPASNTNVVVEDYDQYTTTKYAADIAWASLSAGAYNDFTLNATGVTYLQTAQSGAGIVKFGTRLACDVANTAPGGASKVTNYQCEASDNGGNKPKLVVTYTLPSTFIPSIIIM